MQPSREAVQSPQKAVLHFMSFNQTHTLPWTGIGLPPQTDPPGTTTPGRETRQSDMAVPDGTPLPTPRRGGSSQVPSTVRPVRPRDQLGTVNGVAAPKVKFFKLGMGSFWAASVGVAVGPRNTKRVSFTPWPMGVQAATTPVLVIPMLSICKHVVCLQPLDNSQRSSTFRVKIISHAAVLPVDCEETHANSTTNFHQVHLHAHRAASVGVSRRRLGLRAHWRAKRKVRATACAGGSFPTSPGEAMRSSFERIYVRKP